MTYWQSLRESFVSGFRHPYPWLLQFVGNAIILVSFAGWLNIGEAHWYQLFFTAVLGLILIVATLTLHGGTANYYATVQQEKTTTLRPAFITALRHLPALLIWAAVFLYVRHLSGKLDDYQYAFPGWLRSEFPAWLRRIISEPAMDNAYECFVGLMRWVIVPGLFLPLGLLCAENGFRGFAKFRPWLRTLLNWAWWTVLVIASLLGVYCVDKLLHWTLNPKTATLGGEKTWLAFRMFVAYLVAIYSWLLVCSMLPRARLPRSTAAKKAAA